MDEGIGSAWSAQWGVKVNAVPCYQAFYKNCYISSEKKKKIHFFFGSPNFQIEIETQKSKARNSKKKQRTAVGFGKNRK